MRFIFSSPNLLGFAKRPRNSSVVFGASAAGVNREEDQSLPTGRQALDSDQVLERRGRWQRTTCLNAFTVLEAERHVSLLPCCGA